MMSTFYEREAVRLAAVVNRLSWRLMRKHSQLHQAHERIRQLEEALASSSKVVIVSQYSKQKELV